MIIQDLLLFAHVLFFVYWLGADLGVFYSAGFMLRSDIGTEARLYCTRIMTFLDQAPRISMVGIFTMGSTLGILRGYIHLDPIWILPIWIVGILWVTAVIFLYLNEHHPAKTATVRRIDFNFRIVMIVLLAGLAIASLMGRGVTEDNWLAVKVLLFAGTMACGVLIRVSMKDFGRHFGPMLKGTATPDDIAKAQAMMRFAKIPVLTIWTLVACAAAIGLWKPF